MPLPIGRLERPSVTSADTVLTDPRAERLLREFCVREHQALMAGQTDEAILGEIERAAQSIHPLEPVFFPLGDSDL